MNRFKEKDKIKLFIKYRGNTTGKLALFFKRKLKVIMTMNENTIPSLKPLVLKMSQSNVVYKIINMSSMRVELCWSDCPTITTTL